VRDNAFFELALRGLIGKPSAAEKQRLVSEALKNQKRFEELMQLRSRLKKLCTLARVGRVRHHHQL
jgi:hypothetical protein